MNPTRSRRLVKINTFTPTDRFVDFWVSIPVPFEVRKQRKELVYPSKTR